MITDNNRLQKISKALFIFLIILLFLSIAVLPLNADPVVFQEGASGYTGGKDTNITSIQPTTNYSASTDLTCADGDTKAMVYWDISSIPDSSLATDASITLYRNSFTQTGTLKIFQILQNVDMDNATWNEYDTGQSWQTAGASGANDVSSTPMGTLTVTASGAQVFNLDNSALSVVQSWIANANDNHGVLLQWQSGTNPLQFASNENGTPTLSPKLEITYTSEPTVQASSVSFNSVGTSSMTVTWTKGNGYGRIVLVKAGSAVDALPVDGTTYLANATFGSGAQIGTGNYVVYNGTGNSVSIDGLTANTTYHVAVFELNGSIGDENYNTALEATGSQTTAAVSEPTVQASGVVFTNLNKTSMTVGWTSGNGSNRLVIVKQGSIVDKIPSDLNSYTANAIFGSGEEIGDNSGNYAVYSGSGNSVTVTGLTKGTIYHVAVFEYNGSGGSENYLTITPARGSHSTLYDEPTVQSSNIQFSNVGLTSMTIGWTSGNGSNRLVLMKEGSGVDSQPIDGLTYMVSTIFGSGASIGNNYVVYDGTGNSVTVTGLSAGQTYHVSVFEFNGSNNGENYLTTNPAVASQATQMITLPGIPLLLLTP